MRNKAATLDQPPVFLTERGPATRPGASCNVLEAGSDRAPVDRAHLAKYTCGDLDLEREILELFTDQLPELLARMRQATSDKDWHDAAHTLKGSARAIGATKLGHLAEIAEATGSAQRKSAIEAVASEADDVSNYVRDLVD